MNENESLDDANRLYPEKRWAWQRADYKTSLKEELHQENPAPSWLINIVELAHWVSFPIGFYIAFYLFTNAAVIAQAGHWSGSVTGVFFIMLGILNQVFGGGMAVLMHVYEGWMVAPFKNLLVLPSNPTTEQIDAIRTQNYNNAWLRAAAYQMLMTFQSLGLSLFSLGVFGIKPWTALLVSATVLISLLGPKEPRLDLNRKVDVCPFSVGSIYSVANRDNGRRGKESERVDERRRKIDGRWLEFTEQSMVKLVIEVILTSFIVQCALASLDQLRSYD
ncbi:MAG: hypothetical protein SGPRY_002863 [Prymnesium sp.]